MANATTKDRWDEEQGASPAAGPFSAFERMVAWRYLRSGAVKPSFP